MAVDYYTFNMTFTAFRLANWVRALATQLCDPTCVTDRFLEKEKTVIDAEFIRWCDEQFLQRIGIREGDTPADYMASALGKVRAELNRCTGKTVRSLIQPMRRVETEIVDVLTGLIAVNEKEFQHTAGVTIDEAALKLRRIGLLSPEGARETVMEFRNHLARIAVLPLRTESQPRAKTLTWDDFPPFHEEDRNWITTQAAAEAEGLSTLDLRLKRRPGPGRLIDADGLRGYDAEGRAWAKSLNKRAHPRYWRASLPSSKTTS